MQPSTLTIHEIFEKERRYTVPLFQRAYVWTLEEQWEPLWEDIERQAEHCRFAVESGRKVDATHFMGAVVLNVPRVIGRGVARSEVIDGQQRLTTLQLFLAALRDYARSVGDGVCEDVERLTFNPGKDPTSDQRYKVWPTNSDRKVFQIVLSAGTPDAVSTALAKQGDGTEALPRMAEAYRYFYGKIAALVEGGREAPASSEPRAPKDRSDHLYALLHAFKTSLQMVVIELEDRDDPQVIFETLNARGQPLLPSDLIRNTVFLQASAKDNDVDHLYHTYWGPFDEVRVAKRDASGEDRFWHQQERQGRLIRPRIDLFMFHDLTVRTERELNIGRLFREFREWYGSSGMDTETYLASIKERAEDFARLIDPIGKDRLSVSARRLRSLDTSTVYPVLLLVMGLSRKGLPPQQRDQIATDIESYLVRRLVCQLTTKNYNSFFLGLLRQVAKTASAGGDVALAARNELTRPTGPAVTWPSDKEFRSAWLSKQVYMKSRPDRSAMILAALNAGLHTSKSESIELDESLSVEHLMPQSAELADYPYPSTEELPLGPDESTETRRDRLVHTIGNLTLLTQPLNSSVSNGPFPAKSREIVVHSDLRLNAMFRDAKPPYAIWNEINIRTRANSLFETALRIWPHPGDVERAASPGAEENMPAQNDTLAKGFDVAMYGLYQRALSEARYKATRFHEMLYTLRGVETARALLHSSKVSEGYTALWERGRLDLTVEALIHNNAVWHPLFTAEELVICRKRLTDYKYLKS